MTDVTAKPPSGRRADQRVHVGAVHIHAAAVAVNELAELLDFGLEHAVRARVGDHHRGEPVRILFALRLQLGEVDVAPFVAARDHHLHARHLSARRIRAVGARRDQADGAMPLAAGLLPGADHEQPGVFPLAAGVGLQTDAGVARRLAEPLPQLAVERRVALPLIGGRIGMDGGELGPGDRDHLAGGIELHRAAAQRDHATVEGQVFIGEGADVPQHRRLAVVAREHRMREKGARPPQAGGKERLGAHGECRHVGQRCAWRGKHLPEPREVAAGGGLIEGDRDRPVVETAEVHAEVAGLGEELFRPFAGVDRERVEGGRGLHGHAEPAKALPQDRRVGRDPAGDPREPLWPVVDRVHARHDGGEHLRRADVGGRLLAADVLLAGLEREPVGRTPVRIDAHAHEPARHRPLELIAAGEVGGVGTAAAHRHPEPLRGAHDDVGPPLAGRRQQRDRQQVGGHHHHGLGRMSPLDECPPIPHASVGRRILQEHAVALMAAEERLHVSHDHLDAQRPGPGLEHLDGLRMAAGIDEKSGARRTARPLGERHRLGGGGRLVEQRGVGDRHGSEVADHRLEVDERLHPSLTDLGLIGRVGGVPGRVFHDVSQDHAGRDGAVVPLTDEALQEPVPRGDALQFLERRSLGHGRRQPHRIAAGDACRHDGLDERLARRRADRREHPGLVGSGWPDVAALKLGRVLEGVERDGRPRGRGGDRGAGRKRDGHRGAPHGKWRHAAPPWNPVVLVPERFAAGVGPWVAPSVDSGLAGLVALQQCRSSVLLPERSAFGGLSTLS